MHLPLRYAVSFPILAAIVVAAGLALLTHRFGRLFGLHENYPPLVAGVMCGVASLLLVIPNLAAAAGANRFASAGAPTFVLIFAVGFVACWVTQGLIIKRLLGPSVSWDIFTPLTPWVLVADILLCAAIAAAVGR